MSGLLTSLPEQVRPIFFSDVVGQEVNVSILRAIIKKGELPPAMLFGGQSGGGKTSLGLVFSMSLFCGSRKDDQSPCGQCPSCKEIYERRSLDTIFVDSADRGTVDDVRSLIEGLSMTTDRKVVIFDECQRVSKEGQSVLLNFLETPSSHVCIIGCSTEPERMLDPLRSRMMEFVFFPVSDEDILNRLRYVVKKLNLNVTDDILYKIVDLSFGNLRSALVFLQQVTLFEGKDAEDLFFQTDMALIDRGVRFVKEGCERKELRELIMKVRAPIIFYQMLFRALLKQEVKDGRICEAMFKLGFYAPYFDQSVLPHRVMLEFVLIDVSMNNQGKGSVFSGVLKNKMSLAEAAKFLA